ncbi:hypothetical protein D0865_05090 [Hortaea werneckii]|uniref:Uncharacterized protein n=2 Tax=Hortaea werneckii TaxID=91943 RepID=A0A3M7CPZ1_HORWE|nr:hypothetical protein D0865_05090 [Hortaea werneckii]
MASTNYNVEPAPFPASSKTSSGVANGRLTTVSCLSFADRLLITISQSGKFSHWVHVPFATAASDPMNPGFSFTNSGTGPENDLLPRSDLTATTVLGGTKREEEVIGQTLGTTVASAVLMKRPSEERLLVLGLGLEEAASMNRTVFEEIVGLVLDCL